MLIHSPAKFCNHCRAALLPTQSFCFCCGATDPMPQPEDRHKRLWQPAVLLLLALVAAMVLFSGAAGVN